MISQFQAFNISFVPRMSNTTVDELANVATRLSLLRDNFSIEIIYKPSVPNNITNLYIFNDDQQILHSMEITNVFKYAAINEDDNDKALMYLWQEMRTPC